MGGLVDLTFHEVADLRPYVPPILSSKIAAATLACDDIDAYVRHVQDLNDHHDRKDRFGIHRQKTIEAVNELYDRARCDAHQDLRTGLETYKTLPANWLVDSNDPPAPASPVAALPAPMPSSVELHAAAPTTVISPLAGLSNRHHRIVVGDDQARPAPAPPLQCGPDPKHNGIDWHMPGCPR